MKKVLIVAFIFLVVSLIESFSQHRWVGCEALKFDASGHYLYLPATFIYHDINHLSFYPAIDEYYRPTGDIKWYGIYEQPQTGKRLNKYPMGTALGELPFFLLTDLWLRRSKDYPRDGYSTPYQFAVGMSTIIWGVLGLIVLGRFLLRLFPPWIVGITIFLIAFATNLYCYSSYELGMSHSLLFLQFACVLSLTERWHATERRGYVALLGMLLGWILITRPVDIAVGLVTVLWPLRDGNKLRFFRRQLSGLVYAAILMTAVVSLQLFYWKSVTGSWFFYSYQGEYFNFSHPHILDGLFSYRKGWFVYTPLAFVALLGFIPLYNKNRGMVPALLLFIGVLIYVVFSWHEWYYGWGFGSRPLVEALAVISIPLAALVNALRRCKIGLKALSLVVGAFLVFLNVLQTNQYGSAILHGTSMNKAYYWRIFGKLNIKDEDRKLLHEENK